MPIFVKSKESILKTIGTTLRELREAKGLLAREWVTSDESGMSARQMCENVIDAMNESFEKFTPRPRFEVHKITDRPKKRITHKLIY